MSAAQQRRKKLTEVALPLDEKGREGLRSSAAVLERSLAGLRRTAAKEEEAAE